MSLGKSSLTKTCRMGIKPMTYALKMVGNKTNGSQSRLCSKPLSWLFFRYDNVDMERQDIMIIDDETINKIFLEPLRRTMLDAKDETS
jgi:hypothetical protein